MKVGRLLAFAGCALLLGCAGTQVRTSDLSRAPELKLLFMVDKEYDEDNVVGILRSDDPAGLEARAQSMSIDLEVARTIREAADPSKARELAIRLVEDRFRKDGQAIEASKTELEYLWKDLLPAFSQVVVKTTQSPWVHPEYTCVVSSIHPGLSSWWGNKVAIGFNRDPAFKRRILAHEILLSDVFQLFRRRHDRSEVGDWQVWAFSEVTAFLILNDPRLTVFWPNFPHFTNYPQLADLIVQVRELFDRRTNYEEYEDRSVPLLRTFSPTRRSG